MTRYVGAVDQGTTSTRFMVFDHAGREVARCLTTSIRNWRFDRGPYAVETIVFPFRFTPVSTAERRAVVSS